tara:strand:+ start:12190 stop:13008 length:819 start_codon:yes stop_codon:yes gene_type:complete
MVGEMNIIRVFPRRTSATPRDDYSFVGDPPMIRPLADEVHISVTFTWDKQEAQRLYGAWLQYYRIVKLGGPAYGSSCAEFQPGQYIRNGFTFTSRGCNNQCEWCLVPTHEGRIYTLEIQPGYIVQDNNILQAGRKHIVSVFDMLKHQRKAAILAGGLQASLIDDWFAEELRSIRINQVFLAADTVGALKPLKSAVAKLSYLGRNKLRCYVMIGRNETIGQAKARLQEVWDIGCLPFSQLFQPDDHLIAYSKDWRVLNRTWSRPAATKSEAMR